MLFVTVIVLSSLLGTSLSYEDSWVSLQPSQAFQFKNEPFNVTCDARNVTKPNAELIELYEYHNRNYTLPRTNSTNMQTYTGLLSIHEKGMPWVNVICIDITNVRHLGSKIYELGYRLREIFPPDKKPFIKCQDFNYQVVQCCMTPSIEDLKKQVGFNGEKGANFLIQMLIDETDAKRVPDSSCFLRNNVLILPKMSVSVKLQNDVDSAEFRYTFDRGSLKRAAEPNITVTAVNAHSITIRLWMPYFSIYSVRVECFSNSYQPKEYINHLVVRKVNNITFSGWPGNSVVSCSATAAFSNTKEALPNTMSDKVKFNKKLLEDVPSHSPGLSIDYVAYDTVIPGQYLENVYVYFTDIAPNARNGNITEYKWRCSDCVYRGVPNRHANGPELLLSWQSRLIKMDRVGIKSNFSIRACTKIGCSAIPSYLMLRPFHTGSKKGDNCLLVTTLTDVTNRLFVYWRCSGPSRLVLCRAKDTHDCSWMASRNFLESTGKRNITLPFVVNYGIRLALVPSIFRNGAPENKNSPRHGLVWHNCIYSSVSPRESYPVDTIKVSVDCGFIYCQIFALFVRPSCRQFSDFYIKRLLIYDTKTDKKIATDQKCIRLASMVAFYQPYNYTIYLETINGKELFMKSLTGHVHALRLPIISIILVVLFIIIFLLCMIFRKKIKKRVKDFYEKNHQRTYQHRKIEEHKKKIPLYNVCENPTSAVGSPVFNGMAYTNTSYSNTTDPSTRHTTLENVTCSKSSNSDSVQDVLPKAIGEYDSRPDNTQSSMINYNESSYNSSEIYPNGSLKNPDYFFPMVLDNTKIEQHGSMQLRSESLIS